MFPQGEMLSMLSAVMTIPRSMARRTKTLFHAGRWGMFSHSSAKGSRCQVHLFNCDNTYKLEPVEHLLNKIAELDGHRMCVVKHSFKLAKMSEIVDKISTLAMDMAVFVVHAHESWPSSNEDNRGIGFTKIYRALLQATGKKKKHFHSVDFPLLKFAGVYVIISTVFFRSFPKERDKRNVMQNFGHYLPSKLHQAID